MWACRLCTFQNANDVFTRCEMCNTSRRTSSPVASVIDLTPLSSEKLPNGGDHVASMETVRARKRKIHQPLTVVMNSAGQRAARQQDDGTKAAPDREPLKKVTHPSSTSSLNKKYSDSGERSIERNSTNNNDDRKTEPGAQRKGAQAKMQSTLFGTIVKSIRGKDLSTCSIKTDLKKRAKIQKNESTDSQQLEGNTIEPLHSTETLRQSSLPASFTTNESLDERWDRSQKVLKETFGMKELRNLQPVAIRCALSGQSQIIVMATGGGKSLCYQLPATILPGVTLVVSPLIALMVDQVNSLNEKGVPAAFLSSTVHTEKEKTRILQQLVGGPNEKEVGPPKLKMVYCTPELLETTRFRAILSDLYKRRQLSLFAVDEAHCLSTWGHDFRPAYRKLSWLRQAFQDVPCMACTATATPKVIRDIREVLAMNEDDALCHLSSFNRPNISYEVRYKETLDAMIPGGALANLVQVVKEQHAAASKLSKPCNGIIFVHKRTDTTTLAHQITRATGIKAAGYHAGLKDAERKKIQTEWTNGTVACAVATVAFGMGIDLAHVRYVLHWSMSKSVEQFYQESGRAGRDGEHSVSILYYSKEDASKFSYLITKQEQSKKQKLNSGRTGDNCGVEALQGMVDYCVKPSCRRKYLLQHFGETIDPQSVCRKTCDFCKNPLKTEQAMYASSVMKLVSSTRYKSSGMRSKFTKSEWDGQWTAPHGDDGDDHSCDDYFQDRWSEGDLGITGVSCDIHASSPEESNDIKSFRTAQSVLSKYEVLECQKGKARGFVHFKAKTAPNVNEDCKRAQRNTVIIPEHLRGNLPDPHQYLSNKGLTDEAHCSNKASSSQLSSDLDAMKAKLKKLKAARAAKTQAR